MEVKSEVPSRPGWKTYVPLSLPVLLPVYWQPRVQGGDLSSHIYNPWLAQLIEAGRPDGLQIVRHLQDRMDDVVSQLAPELQMVSGAGRDLPGFGRIAPGN